MLYNPPTGSTDPNAPYVGKNTAAGTQGSKLPPKAVETPQREIVNAIGESGQSPTNDDVAQLLKAVRSGLLFTYTATGTANALVITPITPHTTMPKGTRFRVFPILRNTGPATLQVNQLAYPLLRRDGSALQTGDIAGNVPFDVVHDGLGGFRFTAPAFGEVQRITASATFWVRCTDGSDANDGSSNDSGHAFQTISAALAAAAKIGTTGSAILIRLGQTGNYPAPGGISRAGGGGYSIVGDITNPGGYYLVGPGSASTPPTIAYGCAVTLSGLTVSNTGTIASSAAASTGGTLLVDHVNFACVGGNPNHHLAAFGGGSVTIGEGCAFVSPMGGWARADGGNVSIGPVTLTFGSGLTWSNAGLYATGCGTIRPVGTPIIVGSASGPRFVADSNGVISSNGGGDHFYPGSVDGTTSTGGEYV